MTVKKSEKTKKVEQIVVFVFLVFLGIVVGYSWRVFHELKMQKDCFEPIEFEEAIQTGLHEKKTFWIKDTNIQITPWQDGSGVIRIVKRR